MFNHLSSEAKVERDAISSSKHVSHIERTGRASRGTRSSTRPCPPTDHSCHTRCECLGPLCRGYVVDVRIDPSCCNDKLLPSDDFGGRSNDHVWGDICHNVWVSSLANANNQAFRDANVRLHGKKELEIRQPEVMIRYLYLVDACPVNN